VNKKITPTFRACYLDGYPMYYCNSRKKWIKVTAKFTKYNKGKLEWIG